MIPLPHRLHGLAPHFFILSARRTSRFSSRYCPLSHPGVASRLFPIVQGLFGEEATGHPDCFSQTDSPSVFRLWSEPGFSGSSEFLTCEKFRGTFRKFLLVFPINAHIAETADVNPTRLDGAILWDLSRIFRVVTRIRCSLSINSALRTTL